MQKHGLKANDEELTPNECEVCETEDPTMTWSDLSGEAMCTNCGMSYMVKTLGEYEEDEIPLISVDSDWAEAFKEWWNEDRPLAYIGQLLIEREYKEGIEGRRQFIEWVNENKPELIGGKTDEQ